MTGFHPPALTTARSSGPARRGAKVSAIAAAAVCGATLMAAPPVLAQTAPAPAATAAPAAPQGHGSGPTRNARYCELLPISIGLDGLSAQVFNTLGQSDCPQANWESLTDSELRKAFDSLYTVRNGPRFFIMDQIIASGATLKGEVVTVNGIALEKRADVQLSLSELREKPYQEVVIDRSTVYRFDAGKPTFQLSAPDGSIYVMQAYAQIVDPKLTYADLPTLGAKLKLPAGWTYAMQTPAQELVLTADGKATVLQDDLKNTYQKIIRK